MGDNFSILYHKFTIFPPYLTTFYPIYYRLKKIKKVTKEICFFYQEA